MKFLLQILFIGMGAVIAEQFLPWWSIALVAFVGGYLLKSSQNFLAGFLSIGLVWGAYAFIIDSNGAAPLADRVAAILFVNKHLLILITAVLGGLVAGFATVSGSLLKKNKRKSLYY